MMTHLAKIEGMVGQLRDLGSPIDDNQVVSKVLMTLPSKYANFRESWGLLATADKTKANLIAKLLLSESMLEHRQNQENVEKKPRKRYCSDCFKKRRSLSNEMLHLLNEQSQSS
jgi:hypothetical protein